MLTIILGVLAVNRLNSYSYQLSENNLPSIDGLAWMLSRRISQPIDRQFNTLIKDLELARDTLEEKVKERTQELQESLHRLTKTQSQLVQAEKMSSLGLLVAGVAHEINNPVSFIYSNLTHLQEYTHNLLDMMQLYQKYYPNPSAEIQAEAQEIDLEFVQEDLPKILDSMQLGTDRIQKIVLSLRNFSRLDEAQFKAVDIHEGIDSTLLILQYRIKANSERPQIEKVL
nr:histidine kinase dimerization/phospho-acceptor domain-containing protein [Roseofilum sp. Guam]